jgi:uncharacterized membrane protein
MQSLTRAAGYAALVIFVAFAIHTLNGAYIEPKYLGFASYSDYSVLSKLESASQSMPWLFSGLGHLATGFAMTILALGGYELYRSSQPAAARIALAAGMLAAVGFMLLGISHLLGRQAVELMAASNPGMKDNAFLVINLVRIVFNGLAQVGLGWFTLQFSWCGLRTGVFSKPFVGFGFISGLAGILMGFAYIPVYLLTVLVWSLWCGVVLLRR